ncbi:bifunctional glycosyltransferase 87/phosphatase PAP2 family protein [Streptomyces sp. Qhu-G9]|uniref:bifunctional glycosyltransferase 87/phosphatase PAP2 family protein n=1 Tax=Streptomyces sp. Qhu-G9 TaxID=3452799 RepID=UPI0022ABC7A0|nr:bifunctional glycosyltransferase 87/phosphatase PAP2 family protein [Streptomyces aurantiacus]WAU79913.1 bifunctional glycosyltransferase 87/phosphatase PAP2 family protein [Streptomyces aurantiacus]
MANVEHGGRPGDAFGATGLGAAKARLGMVRAGLWLVAAVLAVRQVAVVLSTPKGERLTDLETWVGPDGVLHVNGSLYDSTRFTGTPLGGLVLKPLTRAAEQALGWGWTFGTLLLVAALGLVAARALPQPVSRRTAFLAAPVAITLLMLSLPVRNTLYLGQTSIIPVLLVLLGCFAVRGERASGVLIGLAAALQPTVLLFAPLLWFTGRRRAAASTGLTFAALTALAWAAMPHDSYTYWVHHLAGVGLGLPADDLANQSLHGALLRIGVEGPPEIALFLALGTAVAVLGLRRAVRYARDGQLLLAVAITGCVAVLVSPTTWQHQLLWVLLALVGRVGKKAGDRYVWPVAVILVMTLPAKMMLPNMESLYPLRDNVVLLAALAAATAVPFLSRTSEYYRSPVPTRYAQPVPTRWKRVPLLPFLRRVLTRPNLLLELLLIRVGYSAYQQVRLAATGGTNSGGRATAEQHGEQIHSIEKFFFIDIEHWVNHAVVRVGWLEDFFNFYYTSFHFVVPLSVLGVLYVRRPADYRWARSALGFATLFALVGFWLYPLAPPRLMPGLGFIDTVHGVQDFTQPDYGTLTALTNQYAAMPSLHFGWSLWCGLVIAILAPRWWMKALGLLHPLFTVSAIVATGNHWVLDAVGGAAVVGAGFALTHLLQGPRPRPLTEPAEEAGIAEPVPAKDRTPS